MGVQLKKYIWILGIFCTLVISYLFAKITTLFIEGTFFPNAVIMAAVIEPDDTDMANLQDRETDVQVILKRNFFDSKETLLATGNDEPVGTKDTKTTDTTEQVDMTDKPIKTNLDIKLYSTFSVGDGRSPQSSCVVKGGKSMETYTVRSRAPFGTGTKITRILAKRVEFIHNKRLEYVELMDFANAGGFGSKRPQKNLDQPKKVTRTTTTQAVGEITRDGDTFQIPRAEINKALNNINKLYTDIRAVPYYKEGKARGFKLLSVKRGSLFQKLGLRRGDVLVSINGKVLDIQSGMETFNTLKNEADFKLELERRGEDKTFSYTITE